MLNVSLISLCLSGCVHSPLFCSSDTKLSKFLTWRNMQFSRFAHPILISRSVDISCLNSKFSAFLATPLRIESEFRETVFYEREVMKQKTIDIVRCVFSQCEGSGPENGGAIFISNTRCRLSVSRTGFYACRSHSSGGSIYASCKTVNISSTCFEHSRASVSAMAFFISASAKNPSSLTHTIVATCGNTKRRGQNMLTITKASIHFTNNNISSNRNIVANGGLSTLDCPRFTLSWSIFIGNLGPGLFHFSGSGANCSYEFCNIINNHAQLSPMFDIIGDGYIFKSFIFVHNVCTDYILDESSSAAIFMQCQFDTAVGAADLVSCTLSEAPETHDLTLPIDFLCFALGAPDPVIPARTTPPATLSQSPSASATATRSPSHTSTSTFSASINWYPDTTIHQYALLTFCIIIIPVFALLQYLCTTDEDPEEREIRALSRHR